MQAYCYLNLGRSYDGIGEYGPSGFVRKHNVANAPGGKRVHLLYVLTCLSSVLLVCSLIGMAVGFFLQDRMDQDRFRRLTLAVLVIAGLNLVRRGLMG